MPKAKTKKTELETDIYKGVHPELERIGRAQNARRLKDVRKLRVPGLLDHKTADEIDADIRCLREK